MRNGSPILLSLHLFRLEKQIEYLGSASQSRSISAIKRLILERIEAAPMFDYALRVDLDVRAEITISTRLLPQKLGQVALFEKEPELHPAWIKCTDRSHWNQEKQNLGVEHLLFHSEGELLEFSEGNLFIFYEDKWFTPPTDSRILSGTMRSMMKIVIKKETGVSVSERMCPLEWLEKDALSFFTSSLRGIVALKAENRAIVSSFQSQFDDLEWIEKHENEILNDFQNSFLDII